MPLPESKYRYTFEYSSLELSSQVIGKWDVVLDGAIQLASGQLIGTEGKKLIIEGIVHVTPQNANKVFENRTYFLAQGDLRVFGTSLQKIPD